jgi:hypothetical protein
MAGLEPSNLSACNGTSLLNARARSFEANLNTAELDTINELGTGDVFVVKLNSDEAQRNVICIN